MVDDDYSYSRGRGGSGTGVTGTRVSASKSPQKRQVQSAYNEYAEWAGKAQGPRSQQLSARLLMSTRQEQELKHELELEEIQEMYVSFQGELKDQRRAIYASIEMKWSSQPSRPKTTPVTARADLPPYPHA